VQHVVGAAVRQVPDRLVTRAAGVDAEHGILFRREVVKEGAGSQVGPVADGIDRSVFEADFEREFGGRRVDRAEGRGALALRDSDLQRFIYELRLAHCMRSRDAEGCEGARRFASASEWFWEVWPAAVTLCMPLSTTSLPDCLACRPATAIRPVCPVTSEKNTHVGAISVFSSPVTTDPVASGDDKQLPDLAVERPTDRYERRIADGAGPVVLQHGEVHDAHPNQLAEPRQRHSSRLEQFIEPAVDAGLLFHQTRPAVSRCRRWP